MSKISMLFAITLCCSIFFSCKEKAKPQLDDVEILHQNQDQLTQVIIYDVFSPPVAARIYAYSSLASYEAMRYAKPGTPSFAPSLNNFNAMPQPEEGKTYNYTLAATKAFFTVVHKVVFSIDSLKDYEDMVFNNFKETLDDSTYARSIAFGDTIAKAVLSRSTKDMYKQTRGMPKYLGSNEEGKWSPTSPDYLDGAEAYWKMIKPFALDSASQFRPAAPFPYSKDSNSLFYNMVKEVYTINKNLTDSQKTVARFWDDNPFVIEHSGHLMFANKKITPGGHWMGITAIACRKSNADAVKTAEAYALTSMALLDGFVSCWDAKYRYEYVRPITVINNWFDKGWTSFLQTPPFPEYTSGHSTITASAATVLTYLFGDNFAYHDNSDSAYIGMVRDFQSFNQAAAEASLSRLYGGIHFRPSLDTGLVCGHMVGEQVLKKLHLQ